MGVEYDLFLGARMTPLKRFRALYGAGPLHLLALLASFAIAAAAVVGWFQRPRDVVNVLEWFAAAIVLHDLVLLPLYSLLDRIAFGGLRKRADQAERLALPGLVKPTAYLRIPSILSGLLLLVFLPVISGLGSQTELSASGIPESGYAARWLFATGVMFAVSGVAYAVAVARAGRPSESVNPGPAEVASDPEPTIPDPEPTTPELAPAPPSDITPAEPPPPPPPPPD